MKLLFENWRKFLKEGVDPRIQKQIDYLLKQRAGFKVLVDLWAAPEEVTIMYGHEGDNDQGVLGKVVIGYQTPGPCFDGYVVIETMARSGMGPLLYEVALEWASQKAGGLMSDREDVSTYAYAVWDKYLDRSDVQNKQMDIINPEDYRPPLTRLTPDVPEDDCIQASAVDNDGEKAWVDSPLSKIYYKSTTEVMDALRAADKLWIGEQ
jgi:hypothetical protein